MTDIRVWDYEDTSSDMIYRCKVNCNLNAWRGCYVVVSLLTFLCYEASALQI